MYTYFPLDAILYSSINIIEYCIRILNIYIGSIMYHLPKLRATYLNINNTSYFFYEMAY